MIRKNNKLKTEVQSLVSYMAWGQLQKHKGLRSEGPKLGATLCWCHLEILNTFEQVAQHLHFLDGRWNCGKNKLRREIGRHVVVGGVVSRASTRPPSTSLSCTQGCRLSRQGEVKNHLESGNFSQKTVGSFPDKLAQDRTVTKITKCHR